MIATRRMSCFVPLRGILLVSAACLTLMACQGGDEAAASSPNQQSPNAGPTISGSPPQSAEVGVRYLFRPIASDADGDTLTFSVTGRPNWMQFDVASGELSGTPTIADVGTTGDLLISASDGRATATLPAFRITVQGATTTNRAPTIGGQPPSSAVVGSPYSFQIVAADADGDRLTYSATALPEWLTLNTSTGRVSGTPGAGNVGTFSGIVLSVSDGKAAASLPAFTLTVTSSQADTTRPVIASTIPSSGATGVAAGTAIAVTFSEAIQASTVTAATFLMSGVNGSIVVSGTAAIFTPSVSLTSGTTYTVTLKGGAGGIADMAGNTLAADVSFSFTVAGGAALSCGGKVRCVGAGHSYATIQPAVDAAQPGDTVLVHDGQYRGFVVSRSGISGNRITVMAAGAGTVIDSTNSAGEGITIDDADYVTIQGFTVQGMSGYGIATHGATATSPMRGLEIRNNIVRDSGSSNIYLSQVANSIIEGNVATGSRTSHGIYLANGGSDDTVLRGNRCSTNAKNGIHFNGDASVGGDGLHSGLVIDGNILFQNVANGLDMDGVQRSTIQNNVIYENGRNAVRGFQIDAAAGPKTLTIVNNTLLVPAGGGWAIKLTEDDGGHILFNNIVLAASGASGSIAVNNTTFSSDYNVVSDRFSLDGDTTTINLAAWRGSGRDAASFSSTTSELFQGPAASDFRLKPGAPAIDIGRNSFGSASAPALDALGSPRPKGNAPDAGAYETF
ncbi:MAG: Ig-like domain-containing protein [Sinobacteraceae bacterium]|nr:Ig-like domain-containing protein [Nevskiaceae bacterium]MCP5470722.1 Ig-like domain-containing protein [Nevskiaceae bacterium]